MCFGGGSSSSDRVAQASRADEVARQERIKTGMAKLNAIFSGYDNNFFNRQRQSYLDFVTPSIGNQFRTARDKLLATLARRGQLNSSVQNNTLADLNRQFTDARTDAESKALDIANQSRQRLETSRSGLVAELNATADPTSTATAAARQAQSFAAPGFTVPANAFANVLAAFDESGLFRERPTQSQIKTYSAVPGTGNVTYTR